MSEASEPSNNDQAQSGGEVVHGKLLPGLGANPVAGQPSPENKLTPEEQMALYEKELKESDWGHQPC